jgi:hypothetical protein
MIIPTEPIGRLPKPVELVDALAKKDSDDTTTLAAEALARR